MPCVLFALIWCARYMAPPGEPAVAFYRAFSDGHCSKPFVNWTLSTRAMDCVLVPPGVYGLALSLAQPPLWRNGLQDSQWLLYSNLPNALGANAGPNASAPRGRPIWHSVVAISCVDLPLAVAAAAAVGPGP